MKQGISLIFFYIFFIVKLIDNFKAMEFNIKDKVKLIMPLSYLKTSENMPPDLVAIDEIGEIISIKSITTVEIRFRRGTFLIDLDKIEKV